MEKLAFALVTMARKLKPYFQTHTVIVLMDKPLRRVMSSLEAAGQMVLQAIKLSEFNIQYRSRMAFKGQIITNFIIEFTNMEGQGAEECPRWSIHMDGASNRQVGRAGVVLYSLKEDEVECMVRLDSL